MGKPSRKKSLPPVHRPSAWSTLEFRQPSELGTLRADKKGVARWLHGAARLLTETPLWQNLATLEPPFVNEIVHLDWNQRPAERLVQDLHVVGSIEEGEATFLPSPYREQFSTDQRRALYLASFLMHGHAAVEENPAEDFGLPKFAHWPPLLRAVLPAARPLWFMLAKADIVQAIKAKRDQYPVPIDGALLALLHEAPDLAERLWLPLLDQTPTKLCDRLAQHFAFADLNFESGQPLDMASSQAFLTVNQLQGDQTNGQLLARAIAGQFNHFGLAVRHGLWDLHKKAATDEKYESRTERLEVVYRDRTDREEIEQEVFATEPRSRAASPEEIAAATDHQQKLCATLDRIAARHPKLAPLIHLYRTEPDLTQKAMATRLKLTVKTCRNQLKQLRTYLGKYRNS